MSNEFEQPVEPMSRAEEILREENVQRPMSRVEDLLQQLVASGSNVTVTPTLNTGVPLAYVTINGVEETIYAPEDVVGSIVTVSPTYDTGTLVATITVNDVPYYIYVPENLPSVTSSDEGKVAMVNSEGKWDKADPPTELPSVTSSDEGKVLTVDSNGAWGAGNNLYEVFYAYEIGSASGRSIYFENGITEADIYNACITNKVVFIKSRDGQNATEYSNTYISTRRSSNTNYIFSATSSDRSNEIKYRFFIVNKNGQNTSTVFATNTTSLPNVDATYNGRVLTVVNGVWNQAKVPSELPAVTSSDEGKVLTVDSNGAWGADNPSGGLPEVTSSDNGKILSVVNGAWGKETLPLKTIIFCYIGNGRNKIILNDLNGNQITQKDVLNAHVTNPDAAVFLINKSGGEVFWAYYMSNYRLSFGTSVFMYDGKYVIKHLDVDDINSSLVQNVSTNTVIPISSSSDNGKSVVVNSSGNYVLKTILPSVTSSDEGKVLTVNSSGQWVASAIPDGTNTAY